MRTLALLRHGESEWNLENRNVARPPRTCGTATLHRVTHGEKNAQAHRAP